jgi:chromosome segregation ATPase
MSQPITFGERIDQLVEIERAWENHREDCQRVQRERDSLEQQLAEAKREAREAYDRGFKEGCRGAWSGEYGIHGRRLDDGYH